MNVTADTETATIDFAARKQAAQAQLSALRDQRGTALAEGTTFDDRKIAQAQIELERITDEETATIRRSRISADEALQERRGRLKAELIEAEQRRLETIKRAEKSCRELVQALRDMRAEAAVLLSLFSLLKISPPLNLANSADSISHKIIAQLSMIDRDHRISYGKIHFGSTFIDPAAAWTAGETINLTEILK